MLENLTQIVGELLIDRRRFLGGLVGGGLMLTTGGYCVGAEEGKKDGGKKEKPRLKWQDYIRARPGIQKMLSQAEKLSQLTLEVNELIEKKSESDKQIRKNKYEELAKEKSKFDEWIRSNFVIGKDGKETRDIPVPFVGNDYSVLVENRNPLISLNRIIHYEPGKDTLKDIISRDYIVTAPQFNEDFKDMSIEEINILRSIIASTIYLKKKRDFHIHGVEGINKVSFGSNEPLIYGIYLNTKDFYGSSFEMTVWNPNDELVDGLTKRIDGKGTYMGAQREMRVKGDEILSDIKFPKWVPIPLRSFDLSKVLEKNGEGDYSVIFLVNGNYLGRKKIYLSGQESSYPYRNNLFTPPDHDLEEDSLRGGEFRQDGTSIHISSFRESWKDPIQYLNKEPENN